MNSVRFLRCVKNMSFVLSELSKSWNSSHHFSIVLHYYLQTVAKWTCVDLRTTTLRFEPFYLTISNGRVNGSTSQHSSQLIKQLVCHPPGMQSSQIVLVLALALSFQILRSDSPTCMIMSCYSPSYLFYPPPDSEFGLLMLEGSPSQHSLWKFPPTKEADFSGLSETFWGWFRLDLLFSWTEFRYCSFDLSLENLPSSVNALLKTLLNFVTYIS